MGLGEGSSYVGCNANVARRNSAGAIIDWHFSTQDARTKLHSLYRCPGIGGLRSPNSFRIAEAEESSPGNNFSLVVSMSGKSSRKFFLAALGIVTG